MFSVRVVGVPQLQAFFNNMAGIAQNMLHPLNEARKEFESVIGEKFGSEGPGWAGHRPLTVLKRQGQGNSGPILQETGTLESSYKRGGPDHYERQGGNFIETGSALKYAGPHEDGFLNKGTVPPTGQNPAVKMRGQSVAARSLLKDGDGDDRIANAFIDSFLQELRI